MHVRPYTWGRGEYDGFVAKLSPDGVLLWNTFLGGTGNDWGNAIAEDDSGYIDVAGEARPPGGTVRPYNPEDGQPS